jgi:hypothetical protein
MDSMSDDYTHGIWLSGERSDVDYLFDSATGQVLQKLLPGRGGMTAGIGQYCRRRFVAVYVAPDRSGLVLQIDAVDFRLTVVPRLRTGDGSAAPSHLSPCHAQDTRISASVR